MTLSTPDLPAETLDHESLFRRLSGGLALVTGNSRLTRVLTGQYNQWRMKQGDIQWPSPIILSWDAWLGELWNTASIKGVEGSSSAVPGSRQLLSLWRSVLRDDPNAQQLLRPESLTTRLRDTRRLAVDWRLDLHHPRGIAVKTRITWHSTIGTVPLKPFARATTGSRRKTAAPCWDLPPGVDSSIFPAPSACWVLMSSIRRKAS